MRTQNSHVHPLFAAPLNRAAGGPPREPHRNDEEPPADPGDGTFYVFEADQWAACALLRGDPEPLSSFLGSGRGRWVLVRPLVSIVPPMGRWWIRRKEAGWVFFASHSDSSD